MNKQKILRRLEKVIEIELQIKFIRIMQSTITIINYWNLILYQQSSDWRKTIQNDLEINQVVDTISGIDIFEKYYLAFQVALWADLF